MNNNYTNTFTVDTRKAGCEIFVSNGNRSYFIGECYPDTPEKSVALTMKHANTICNALNIQQIQTEEDWLVSKATTEW